MIQIYFSPIKTFLINFFASTDMELENISVMWFKSNKLSMNVDKTKWLLLHPHSKRNLHSQTLPNLHIENIYIKREHVKTFLGVFVDDNLS